MPRIACWVTLVTALTFVPVVPVFAAQSALPTVTFSRWGPCGSRPDVHELTVGEGAHFLVVNKIGVDATAAVDNEDVMDVPDGGDALLVLPPGEHRVTMAPGCQPAKISASRVTVTVGASEDPAPLGVAASDGATLDASHPGVSTTGSPTGPHSPEPTIAGASANPGGRRLPLLLAVVASSFLIGVVAAIARVVVGAGRRADHEANSTATVALAAPRQRVDDDAANYVRKRLRELVQAAHRGADPRQVEAEREELFARYTPAGGDSPTQRDLDDRDAEMHSSEPGRTDAPERAEPNEPTSPVS